MMSTVVQAIERSSGFQMRRVETRSSPAISPPLNIITMFAYLTSAIVRINTAFIFTITFLVYSFTQPKKLCIPSLTECKSIPVNVKSYVYLYRAHSYAKE
jgi:hypothetical protein